MVDEQGRAFVTIPMPKPGDPAFEEGEFLGVVHSVGRNTMKVQTRGFVPHTGDIHASHSRRVVPSGRRTIL